MSDSKIMKRDEALAMVERQLTGIAKKKIEAALAGQLDASYFLGSALAVIKQSGRLAECAPSSLLSSVYQCAVFRMIPDPALGWCYIIPRKVKGRMLAQFQLGYKGSIALMYRSRLVSAVRANVVRSGEPFVWKDGYTPILDHEPSGDPERQILGAWAVVETIHGGKIPAVLSRAQIEKVKQRSDAGARGVGPWAHPDDYAPMAMKTAIIRAGKFAPVEIEIQRAIALDERAEAGVAQPIEADFMHVDGEPQSAADAFEEIEASGVEDGDPEVEEEYAEEVGYILARMDGARSMDEVNGLVQEAKDAGLSVADRKRVKAAATEAMRRLK